LDDDEPESATEPGTVAQLGERGVAEALNAIAQGRVQTLYIGELAPMNYLDPLRGGGMRRGPSMTASLLRFAGEGPVKTCWFKWGKAKSWSPMAPEFRSRSTPGLTSG
jgi:hypothetical protein